MRKTTLLLSTLLLTVGCSSSADKEEAKEYDVIVSEPPNKTIELDEFQNEWDDIDTNEQGIRDPYQVARWVTERHNAVMKCLRQDPPARVQAAEMLYEVLERVPDSSRDRYLMIRIRFTESAYWFRAADVFAWEMDRILYYKTSTPDSKETLNDAQVKRLVSEIRPKIQEANKRLQKRAREAVRHLERYMSQRPDDRSVLDMRWKLHFYLQDYESSRRWLQHLLEQWAAEGEPLYKQYSHIRDKLENYLANLKVEGLNREPGERGSTVLPWKDDRGRMLRKKLHLSEGDGFR